MDKSLSEIRRVLSQAEVAASDGKQVIFYPGLASRLSKESEDRIVNKVERMLDESEERQSEVLDQIHREVKTLQDRASAPSKKNRWFS